MSQMRKEQRVDALGADIKLLCREQQGEKYLYEQVQLTSRVST